MIDRILPRCTDSDQQLIWFNNIYLFRSGSQEELDLELEDDEEEWSVEPKPKSILKNKKVLNS